MRCTTLPCAVLRPFTAVNRVLPPPRTTLGLAALWGADIAGTWTLPNAVHIVVNGGALAVTAAMLSRRTQARIHKVAAESHEREMFLLSLMADMAKAPAPEPEPGNDRLTGPLRVVSGL